MKTAAPSRVALRFAFAWAILTTLGASLHRMSWVGAPPAVIDGVVGRSLMNLFVIGAAPGWGALRVTGAAGLDSAPGAVAASALGWAFWLGALGFGFVVRRRLLRPDVERAPARAAVNLDRRRFLVDAPLAAAGAVGAVGGVGATFVQPWRLSIARYTIPIRGLPASLDGMRIVQISDTHLGAYIPAGFVQRAVEQALELRPHLFALTGDYILGPARLIEPAADLFRPLCAPGAAEFGVVGVLGNHDWWADGDASTRALARIGVRMIDNRRIFIDAGLRAVVGDQPSGPALCIAGFGDLLEHRVDVAVALRAVDPATPRIVLAHNPDTAEIADVALARAGRPPERIDLMLSGHTHGGQVRLPLLGTPVVPSVHGAKYASGVVAGPICPVVVSRGVGMSVLPLRLGVPPEIVELTLTAGA